MIVTKNDLEFPNVRGCLVVDHMCFGFVTMLTVGFTLRNEDWIWCAGHTPPFFAI